MPVQKDLKRLVRSRMEKTGESYTAARLQLVRKSNPEPTPAPPPDYASIAGMSDAAIQKNTGRTWSEWVKTLDAVNAAEKPHGEIARYVRSLGTPDWWTQGVTVGYERIRGLREKGQRRGGAYEANKSRTFAFDVKKVFKAFSNAKTRSRWLIGRKHTVRTANEAKNMRIAFDDGTLVQVYFVGKGAGKTQVAVQHQKIKSKSEAEQMKVFWGERFDALSELLSKTR